MSAKNSPRKPNGTVCKGQYRRRRSDNAVFYVNGKNRVHKGCWDITEPGFPKQGQSVAEDWLEQLTRPLFCQTGLTLRHPETQHMVTLDLYLNGNAVYDELFQIRPDQELAAWQELETVPENYF